MYYTILSVHVTSPHVYCVPLVLDVFHPCNVLIIGLSKNIVFTLECDINASSQVFPMLSVAFLGGRRMRWVRTGMWARWPCPLCCLTRCIAKNWTAYVAGRKDAVLKVTLDNRNVGDTFGAKVTCKGEPRGRHREKIVCLINKKYRSYFH